MWNRRAKQYAHGVNKGTLAANVAKVEAKEKELAEAKAKAKVTPLLALYEVSRFFLSCVVVSRQR